MTTAPWSTAQYDAETLAVSGAFATGAGWIRSDTCDFLGAGEN